LSLTGSESPEAVKRLLPPEVGASVVLDSTRHMRWACHYPLRTVEPRSYRSTFGEREKHRSRADALRSCLKWL
jgi:hypothetical protein